MTIWEIRLLWIWILNARLPLICRGLNTVLFCLQSIPTCKLSQKIMATLLPSQTNCQKFIFYSFVVYVYVWVYFIHLHKVSPTLARYRSFAWIVFVSRLACINLYISVCVCRFACWASAVTHTCYLFFSPTPTIWRPKHQVYVELCFDWFSSSSFLYIFSLWLPFPPTKTGTALQPSYIYLATLVYPYIHMYG